MSNYTNRGSFLARASLRSRIWKSFCVAASRAKNFTSIHCMPSCTSWITPRLWPGDAKTRTCAGACNGWPNRFASRLASRKARIYLCRLALMGGQTVKNLRTNLSSTKRKWVATRNASRKLVSAVQGLKDPMISLIATELTKNNSMNGHSFEKELSFTVP